MEDKRFKIENGILKNYTGEDLKVTIPNGVAEIGKFCFEDTNVEEIVISSTVERISDVAFNETPYLKRIVVDSDNPTYCSVDGCLYSKDKKRFICSPNRVERLNIVEGCEIIAPYAFFQRKVAGITFPKTLKRFEHSALCNCNVNAKELIIGDVEFCDGEWFCATALPPLVKVEGIKVLESGAFAYSSFGAMLLPNTLTEIGDYSFYNCNMKRVYVPKTVTKLGENVFAVDCPVEAVDVMDGWSEEYSWYSDEEQNKTEECHATEVENCLSSPVGFLLGVDDETCAATKYAKEHNIPYVVVENVEEFLTTY